MLTVATDASVTLLPNGELQLQGTFGFIVDGTPFEFDDVTLVLE